MLIGSYIARYQVLKLLGEGGMGAVYLVEHVDLKTRHAVKVLLPHLSKHPQIVQRFRNEARAAAATRSPNIVAVRDFGQLDNGAWYLVMDYWEGATLAAFLGSRGPLPHGLILRITSDALNGLSAAHNRNIIHRDLKPDNLYLAQVDDDLRTMILDFGVCRLGEDAGLVTRTGAVLGTPRYMAPEQFRGQIIDHRADLWAIGAIVYEMATGGWLPYDDDGVPRGQAIDDAVFNARMSFPPVDPQRRCPGITRALADAILTLIDPDPARRPSSASACAVLLAATLPGNGREPSGFEIVQQRAPDLLKGSYVRDPARSSMPAVALPDHPAHVVAQVAMAPPLSTLSSIASQSPPRVSMHRRRWMLGALAAVIVSAGALAGLVLADRAPPTAESANARITITDAGVRLPIDDTRQLAVATTTTLDASILDPASMMVDARAPGPELMGADARVPDSALIAVDASAPELARGAAHPDARVPAASSPGGPSSAASRDAGVTAPRPAARVSVETGALAIYVAPFAQVWVDDARVSVGQTPLHLKLRVGRHRIRLANARLHKETTVLVTITTAKESVIDETW